MISEIYRVLKPSGVYIIVSYGQPEYRLHYLEKPEFEWTVKVQQIPKPTITSSVSITP
jgi:ubiquinone/menaquinone biosynthesis C-methylase UbiE